MKLLFTSADKYLQQCSWKDMALLKFCLISLGIFMGIHLPEKHKKAAGWTAFLIFAASCAPLMAKYFRILSEKDTAEDA